MNVDFYEYDGLGYVVDPESDTKVVTVILIGKQTENAVKQRNSCHKHAA